MQMSYELAFIKTVDQLGQHNKFRFLDQVPPCEQKPNSKKVSVSAISLLRWCLYSNKLANMFQKNYSAQNKYLHF